MFCYQALIWNEDKISATSYAVLFSYRDARIQQLNLMKIYFIMEYLGRNDRYIFMNANTSDKGPKWLDLISCYLSILYSFVYSIIGLLMYHMFRFSSVYFDLSAMELSRANDFVGVH